MGFSIPRATSYHHFGVLVELASGTLKEYLIPTCGIGMLTI